MRHVILSAPKRREILDKSLARMSFLGVTMPEVVLGADFVDEHEAYRAMMVTEMHREVWKRVVSSGETAVVYEDDAYYLRGYGVYEPPVGTMLFLGVLSAVFRTYRIGGTSFLYRFKGSHAYVVNSYAARMLLLSSNIVDKIMHDYCLSGRIVCMVPTPYVCCQFDHVSGISLDKGPWKVRHTGKERNGKIILCSELVGVL